MVVASIGALPWQPAHADETVVVHGGDFPDPERANYLAVNCNDHTAPITEPPFVISIIYSDDAPPIGLRAQGFDLQGGNAVGAFGHTLTPSTSVLTMRVRPDQSSVVTGRLFALYAPPGELDSYWKGTAALTESGPGWRTVNGAGAVFQWSRYDGNFQAWSPAGSATLPAFVAAHGGDGTEQDPAYALLGMAFGCDGNRFYFDGLRVGSPGGVTTYDFEGSLTVTLAEATRDVVTAGRSVTLRGAPDPAVSRWSNLELTLEARPFGQAEFTPVGTATSTMTDDGSIPWADLVQRPQVRTEYRWVIPVSRATDGSTSPVEIVEVRTAVTAKVADDSLRKGAQLVVKGVTEPKQDGARTTLQRYAGGKWRKLDTGRTKTNGSYAFAHKITSKGTWKVRVLVAATDSNLAGTSPVRKVTVR